MESMLNGTVPLLLLTDCQFLFSTLTTYRHTTERGPMLDLATLREAYSSKLVAKIDLIASENNVAYALTKLQGNQALRSILSTSRVKHPVPK